MRDDDDFTQARLNILVVDSCSFRRMAICHCLSPWYPGVAGVRCLEDIQADRVAGVVICPGRPLSDLMHMLRSLAALLAVKPLPVALVTDMSLCCARSLLDLAGVPVRASANIRVVPPGLKPAGVRDLLLAILRGTSGIPGVGRGGDLLSPLHFGVLKSFVDGTDDVALKLAAGVSIKTIYSQRHATLRRLQVTGLHALLCGRFVRPVATVTGVSRGGRDMS